jgi:hypothetical protein
LIGKHRIRLLSPQAGAERFQPPARKLIRRLAAHKRRTRPMDRLGCDEGELEGRHDRGMVPRYHRWIVAGYRAGIESGKGGSAKPSTPCKDRVDKAGYLGQLLELQILTMLRLLLDHILPHQSIVCRCLKPIVA